MPGSHNAFVYGTLLADEVVRKLLQRVLHASLRERRCLSCNSALPVAEQLSERQGTGVRCGCGVVDSVAHGRKRVAAAN